MARKFILRIEIEEPMLVKMREKAKRLEEKKRALGIENARFVAARNKGISRTSSKRALLQTLSDEARQQGRELPFVANF